MSRPNTVTVEHRNHFKGKIQQNLAKNKARFVELPFDIQPMFEQMVPQRARDIANELSNSFNIDVNLYHGQHLEFTVKVDNPYNPNTKVSRDINVALAKPVWAYEKFHRNYSNAKLTEIGEWFRDYAEKLTLLGETFLRVQIQLERYFKCLVAATDSMKTAGQFYQNCMDIEFCLHPDLIWRGKERSVASDPNWKVYEEDPSPGEKPMVIHHGCGYTLEEFKEAKGALLVGSIFPEKAPAVWPDEYYR